MKAINSFLPIESGTAKIVILGSMPGVLSLQQQQYYAHPRNAFWYIMARLFDFEQTADYATRIAVLQEYGVAVWDVLASCQRQGSLDSAIALTSERPNDFGAFFAQHPSVRWVFFNGCKAESVYQKQILQRLPSACQQIQYQRLPSTSPAMATLSKEQKYAQWRIVLEKLA